MRLQNGNRYTCSRVGNDVVFRNVSYASPDEKCLVRATRADVVKTVNVAFRGLSVILEYCDPCS